MNQARGGLARWGASGRDPGAAPVPSPFARHSRGEALRQGQTLSSGLPEVGTPWAALSCLSPARSIALLYVYGHSRSSAVSSASTEHGASTSTWEGGPLREEPPGNVQPRSDTWLAQ